MVDGPASDSALVESYDVNALLVIICSALAGYNALELLLLIFTTFSVYRGLYFWSLLISTFAIFPYAIGLCIFYFEWTVKLVGYIINNAGWWFMVTGQSVVLYSRLGIVLGSRGDSILKFVKWMIIVDAVTFHTMATVVVFGRYYAPNPDPFSRGYRYVEKIQMTAFCLQEFIISGIYVWKTLDILKTGQRRNSRRIIWQLLTINVVIIVIDVVLLALEYRNLFIPEVSFKELAYSIKLKLEFAILSKLVGITQKDSQRPSSFWGNAAEFGSDPGPSHPGDSSAISSPILTTISPPAWTIDVEGKHYEKVKPRQRASHDSISECEQRQADKAEAAGAHSSQTNEGSVDRIYAEAIRAVSK